MNPKIPKVYICELCDYNTSNMNVKPLILSTGPIDEESILTRKSQAYDGDGASTNTVTPEAP